MAKNPFIIAEIGINHNGSIKICKKLIDIAKRSGCDAVKFQKRNIDLVYSKDQLDSPRESPWGKTTRDQKKGLELNYSDYCIINNYCKKLKINWFASAWDLESIKFLKKFNLKYNKIASAMLVDKKFLHEVAKQRKYTFISTGMSYMQNISDAVKIFKANKCKFELMHCVSTYPMRDNDANLKMINKLKDKFKCDVGYSGHENGIAISVAAATLGATSIERHITIDRTMYGSDQSASIEEKGLAEMVKQIKKIKIAMGDGLKKFLKDEKKIASKLRSHIL
jgi:N-acetylneuraminate synthase